MQGQQDCKGWQTRPLAEKMKAALPSQTSELRMYGLQQLRHLFCSPSAQETGTDDYVY